LLRSGQQQNWRKLKKLTTITVIGKDKTGVVARVTGFLFEQGANIEGLEEQVTRGNFSMTIQASWKLKDWQPENMTKGLAGLAAALGMDIKLRVVEEHRIQKFALLVTKESHALEAVLAGCRSGALSTKPALVVANRPELESLAKAAKIPFVRLDWNDRTRAEEQTLNLLAEYGIDFVVLARFMKILSPNFVWRYKNKIINIHPSLLPSFPGAQAYRQAYERGVKIAGVTAHFVTMNLDEGPIIAQGSFPVRPGMELREVIRAGQKLESKILVKAIRLYLRNRLDVYWGVVREI
jgi:formyltetrahydrofolate deformylase